MLCRNSCQKFENSMTVKLKFTYSSSLCVLYVSTTKFMYHFSSARAVLISILNRCHLEIFISFVQDILSQQETSATHCQLLRTGLIFINIASFHIFEWNTFGLTFTYNAVQPGQLLTATDVTEVFNVDQGVSLNMHPPLGKTTCWHVSFSMKAEPGVCVWCGLYGGLWV